MTIELNGCDGDAYRLANLEEQAAVHEYRDGSNLGAVAVRLPAREGDEVYSGTLFGVGADATDVQWLRAQSLAEDFAGQWNSDLVFRAEVIEAMKAASESGDD